MVTEEYNAQCAARFEATRQPEDLETYVMSEILPPIRDYENAVEIIPSNFSDNLSNELLIVGAYLSSGWTDDKNQLLEYLQTRYHAFSQSVKSIFWFLNAWHLRCRNCEYATDPMYTAYLKRSISYGNKFVYNRIYLEDAVSAQQCQKLHAEALENICKVYSQSEIESMTVDQMADSDMFIKEHVLGTHIPYTCYEVLCNKRWA